MPSTHTSPLEVNLSTAKRSEMLLSLALFGVLVVLLVPLPPAIVDTLLAANLSLTILLLLITIGVTQPLDVSVFPSLLLLLTLYRLSLNVATTRLILLEGDAGRIVSTFGGFVAGGNLVVGLVIFLILVIVQFIVITKGAGRVSEVAARFTLDAMPGKQMAVDSELSAGTIDENEAQRRREHLAREAEFYGAMDGASKFVRGDAIAGLIITAVNLLGGIVIGISNGLSLANASARYSILTIGDGLVSQIPALIVATTVGIIVTKAATRISLGREISTQLSANRRAVRSGAVIVGLLALAPGLPKLPFVVFSLALYTLSRRLRSEAVEQAKTDTATNPTEGEATRHDQIEFNDFLQTDRVTLEVGARLIPFVDSKDAKGLRDRVAGLRSDLVDKHGIWVPAVRIRDNLQLDAEAYRVLICGREVARGTIRPDDYLVLDVDENEFPVPGHSVKDPAFGLPARWVSAHDRHRAELTNHTVVDAQSVLTTHFGEVLKRFAHELLSREDLQKLLEILKETSSALVEDVKPDGIRIGVLHQVLIMMLREKVPITNLARILETLSENITIKEPDVLLERTRVSLGRDICDRFRTDEGRVRVIVVDPLAETKLRECLSNGNVALQPTQLEKLVSFLSRQWQKCTLEGGEVALLVDASIRRAMHRAIERSLSDLAVIAYTEVPSDMMIEPAAMLRFHDLFENSVQEAPSSPTALQNEEPVEVAVA